MRIIPRQITLALLGVFLAGCAATSNTTARWPQTTDEFISTYNWGGIFQNVERMTVDRPSGAVVASLKQYAKECLDINVNKKRAARYATSKYERPNTAPPVTYTTRVGQLKNGATALSVQEWGEIPDEKGQPPGGRYTMAAEVRAVGKKTEVNIYHLAKPFLANPLKGWIAGDKRDCPAL